MTTAAIAFLCVLSLLGVAVCGIRYRRELREEREAERKNFARDEWEDSQGSF